MPKLNSVKTEMLTKEERTRFIETAKAAPNRKAGQLMLMAYYTGMRRNELFGLKWTHIDFERGFINIVGRAAGRGQGQPGRTHSPLHVQKLLTHKDRSLTQRYAHLEDEALKRAGTMVGDFLHDAAAEASTTESA